MKNMQPIRGFHDVSPNEMKILQWVEKIFWETAKLYNCFPVKTPVLEKLSLFTRTLGETSDVVQKEMYSFVDKDEESLVLRPEVTTSVCRYAIHTRDFQRLCYFSDVFRRDRPQKGRYRSFTQAGVEFLGEEGDLEVILFAVRFLRELGILGKTKLLINNLGSMESRSIYVKEFVKYLQNHYESLSELSKIRIIKNPLRIWDSKEEQDRQLLQQAPTIDQFLSVEEREYNKYLIEQLTAQGVLVEYSPSLVRGLDYYNGIVFEFIMDNMTILAGGRFDKMISIMSQDQLSIPATGWACGVERAILAMDQYPIFPAQVVFYFCAMENIKNVYPIMEIVRNQGYKCVLVENQGLSKMLQFVAKNMDIRNDNFAVILGEEEQEKKQVVIKNMQNKEQKTYALQDLLNNLEKNIINSFSSTNSL